MRGLSIEFKATNYGMGSRRGVAGCATLICGCRLRDAVTFPAPRSPADQAREDGKAKLVVIRALEGAAKTHDHDLHVKQQVLRRVTRRLKS